MPEMIVSLVSGLTWVLKVGSSLVKRFRALDMLTSALLSFGMIASEMTGLGTYMEVMVRLSPGAMKVSPEAQSMPKRAPM